MIIMKPNSNKKNKSFIDTILEDYKTACISREVSLMGRREVLTGKAKFGIFGAGKELPQVAMARAFKPGDFRSGYYRDQTFLFAKQLMTPENFFAQLYADPDAEREPNSAGRQMTGHFLAPLVYKNNDWLEHKKNYNISADISPTGGQMARALGLALASKKYRENPKIYKKNIFSDKGNEVTFCTIGDASTSEGVFWETVNAAAVQRVPLAISIWDDGYGISVPREFQTTKGNISEILEGFRINEKGQGMDIYTCKAWDYPALIDMYEKGISKIRETHIPAIFHIQECTQPQGHSTSGSHERYKSKERLQWETDWDCIEKMKKWIIEKGLATESELDQIRQDASAEVKAAKTSAWKAFNAPIKADIKEVLSLYKNLESHSTAQPIVQEATQNLKSELNPVYHTLVRSVRRTLQKLNGVSGEPMDALKTWLKNQYEINHDRYNTHLYNESEKSALKVPVIPATFPEQPEQLNGFQILNRLFDHQLNTRPEVFAFGEDVGQIGDVNQGFAGMQDKHGIERVFDTGIREWTIIGQAIGMAMRGLRPIAEIQYLDYLIYAASALSDDLATVQYRSYGTQIAPAIIRTRGHRLEGIWHSGSPMGMIIHALRGMFVLVPRNMVQAAGMYNTMLQSNDSALIVECLNGYRLKENLPENLTEFTVPLGVPEVLKEGTDVTIVSYGSTLRIAEEGIAQAEAFGISVELIDVQTLLPFDLEHRIVGSLQKTNRIIFLDEDVPGGASAYMMQKVLEEQGGYRYLDSAPKTLTAKAHRPPYGSDGDYFSKPNAEDIFDCIYNMMTEAEPGRF